MASIIPELVKSACDARAHAYAPYSGFKVGAAVLTTDGKIYTGCNVENASYGLSNCAERTAIFKAISEGASEFSVLAVAADTLEPVMPCGACLQVMKEFEFEKVIMSNINGVTKEYLLRELLPFGFNKKILFGVK